ncbi:hypothetical protein TNCT_436501 [Trichonephila clavata]|uniref:Uncharacterized protein n=1 Tax=Trichonephila clavata TaxID=2740835 RepID=A0A8X6F9J9_TRICU|nr:hypothetical protein TNCT_436501 [Trichonephila clavata]
MSDLAESEGGMIIGTCLAGDYVTETANVKRLLRLDPTTLAANNLVNSLSYRPLVRFIFGGLICWSPTPRRGGEEAPLWSGVRYLGTVLVHLD